jgi:hypothetical protein
MQNDELTHDTDSRALEPSMWEGDPQEPPLKITA